VIDQLHDEIKLVVVAAERENPYDVRIIDRSRDARFLLQLDGVTRLGAFAQNLQGDETVQVRVAGFVDRSHAAHSERFNENEMIEDPFDADFSAAARTTDTRERLGIGGVNLRAASGTSLRLRAGLSFGHYASLISVEGGSNARPD